MCDLFFCKGNEIDSRQSQVMAKPTAIPTDPALLHDNFDLIFYAGFRRIFFSSRDGL